MTKIIAFQICNSKYEINIEGTNVEKKKSILSEMVPEGTIFRSC